MIDSLLTFLLFERLTDISSILTSYWHSVYYLLTDIQYIIDLLTFSLLL